MAPPPLPTPERREPIDPLYRLARALIRLAMRLYFRRIAIRGREHIPARGPVILASNHPSGLIDAFSIGLATPRKVSFTARSTLFATPWKARLLARLGVIPVYRPLDAASELEKNVDVFRHCRALLEGGGVIGIFPEGVTHVDPQLKALRTGAVRIGLEAEAHGGFAWGVRIVPIGLNFSRPGGFRSDLTLRVGEPICLADHAAAYAADPAATVHRLTAELGSRIEGLIVHLADLSKQPIVAAACEMFASDWVRDPWILPEVEDEATREIEVRRRIASAVEYYSRFQPAWATELARRIELYRASLERLHVSDEMLRRRVGALPLLKETVPAALVGVAGAPLALFGWLINALPQRVTAWAADRFAANPTQLAAWRMWIGLQAFAIFYAAVAVLLHRALDLGRLGMLVAVLLLPVTGYLSSRYFALMKDTWRSVRLTTLHLLRRGRLQELRFRRQQLARHQEQLRGFLTAASQAGEPEARTP